MIRTATVRFLSIEPLLGALDLKFWNPANPQSEGEWMAAVEGVGVTGKNRPVDWVICGGESGQNARPTHPDWVRSIRDQCVGATVPFFFKQWGEWYPIHGTGWLHGDEEDEGEHPWTWLTPSGERYRSGDGRPDALMIRSGKKLSGRMLDGREWSEFPEVINAQ